MSILSLDGDGWLIAIDPKNIGREEKWFKGPVRDIKKTYVPYTIQTKFPGYHGVAWYWRTFIAPENLDPLGRYLLRFWAVDYFTEVWVNGIRAGDHEGGEGPFVLDVTDAVKMGQPNMLAVRVLNPTTEPIDGFKLAEVPHGIKVEPYSAGAGWNYGGIVDSVELLVSPALRISDLFVRPEWETGKISIQASMFNTTLTSMHGHIELTAAPAASGETCAVHQQQLDVSTGNTTVDAVLQVATPKHWELNDPFLYRVTARVWRADGPSIFDEYSVRCGFRDFRFHNGYFRLNGKRIYLRSAHTCNDAPIGQRVPHDPDLFRRDMINMKMMGFNMVRFHPGTATRNQLDLCDELGLLVYEQALASWLLDDSPKMTERYDRSLIEIILRDRNHPSIVIWGLLNETPDGPVFRHAIDFLPQLRTLDDTRMVLLNSGRFDQTEVGDLSNPGSELWENMLCDRHEYPGVPHLIADIDLLRTMTGEGRPIFLSEYGIGTAVDLVRAIRHFERLGATNAEDTWFFQQMLDSFMSDWERWRIGDVFATPEDYFRKCLLKGAGQRLLGINAVRANPNIISHSVTGGIDHLMTGEGPTTLFRELKPGQTDALFDAWAHLRLCLFVDQTHIYRGDKLRLDAVVANEDQLRPGEFAVRLQVSGPNNERVFKKLVTFEIPDPVNKPEPPLALPIFSEEQIIDGPTGKYRFLANFVSGAAAAGGESEFYVTDRVEMPAVTAEVSLWGANPVLDGWLDQRGITTLCYDSRPPSEREVILVSAKPEDAGSSEVQELFSRIAAGATAVILSPEALLDENATTIELPNQGEIKFSQINSWLYLWDEWAKAHPIFEGMPSGGLMDYNYYGDLLRGIKCFDIDFPCEAVAGAIKTSQGYDSGLIIAVCKIGSGQLILNTMNIEAHLGRHPAAERLLRNMLNFTARGF